MVLGCPTDADWFYGASVVVMVVENEEEERKPVGSTLPASAFSRGDFGGF